MTSINVTRTALTATVSAAALLASIVVAEAGGFAVREQSAVHQGASFAGAASGSDLSTMYWNPAGVTVVDGMNTASSYALILPNSDITPTGYRFKPTGTPLPTTGLGGVNPAATGGSGEIGNTALVASSYANAQLPVLDPRVYIGASVNAPFGLSTEPDNRNWDGSLLSRSSEIFNIVATPTVGFKVSPGFAIGVGVQIGYMEGTLKFGPAGASNLFYNGDDYSAGWTAGVMLTPTNSTRIGVGFRSSITYDLDGTFGDNIIGTRFAADTQIETPEIVTVSLTQAITDRIRAMATYEWTNWSRFDRLDIIARQSGVPTALAFSANTLPTGGVAVSGRPFASLITNWDDGWYGSVGLEFDYSAQTTLRAGVAYEKSPIQNATQRLTAVPDNDRTWLSAGLTHRWSDKVTIDLGYTHIFIDDSLIERDLISNNTVTFTGRSDDQSVDIINIGFRYKWDEPEPEAEPLK